MYMMGFFWQWIKADWHLSNFPSLETVFFKSKAKPVFRKPIKISDLALRIEWWLNPKTPLKNGIA